MMQATQDIYQRHLQALLPQGPAWPTDTGSTLLLLLRGFAGELARTHNRALDLIEEADPRTTFELLTDWERVCGLPDDCTPAAITLAERRDAIVTRLTARGGQSRAYFITVAEALGYTITIDEFRPFTCESLCTDPLNGGDWAHAWRVNGPEETIREFTCESPCDEPLRNWGNEILECRITALKPAHSIVLFSYGG